MSTSLETSGVRSEIEARGLRVGNTIKVADTGSDTATTASTTIYSDSSGKLAAGGLPFAIPLSAGATDTSFSIATITGASTLTANDVMHQTLVAGAGVTTFTSAGFARVQVTDSAGNITTGNYYVQFGTLS